MAWAPLGACVLTKAYKYLPISTISIREKIDQVLVRGVGVISELMMDLSIFIFDWTTSFVLLILTSVLLYLYGTWSHSTWSRLGIPGPKPLPFIGNFKEFRYEGLFQMNVRCSKKYGKNFGVYSAGRPILVTTDADILKEVLIKDFNNFSERMSSFDSPLTPYPMSQGLVFVDGEQWKRQRQTMTPSFSASKLKMMSGFLRRCCQNLMKCLEKKADAGKLLDVKETFGSFTLDVIAGTGFGFETNCQGDVDNAFLRNAKEVFGNAQPFSYPALISNVFPFLSGALLTIGFSLSPLTEVNYVINTIRAVMEDRKRGSKTNPDFMQLILDVEASEAEVASNPQARKLTTDEILAQGLLFFVAGYETTATTLQFLSYLLALNPDKQEKLHNEIVAAIGNADPTYENVMDISYLDCCVREGLRFFPPVAMVTRKAAQERTIKGVKIPAGTGVGINIVGITRDEEYFPQPDKFLPERFQDDAQPIPALVKEIMFGGGPRQCIGMRLALFETKVALVHMVRKFRFVKTKETPMHLNFLPVALALPDKPILLAIERR